MYMKKDDYELQMLQTFFSGMQAGYGVEHTNITEDENKAIEEYAKNHGFNRTSLIIK